MGGHVEKNGIPFSIMVSPAFAGLKQAFNGEGNKGWKRIRWGGIVSARKKGSGKRCVSEVIG